MLLFLTGILIVPLTRGGVSDGGYSNADVSMAVELGIVPIAMRFDYDAPATRLEMAELLVNALAVFQECFLDWNDNYKFDYDIELTKDELLRETLNYSPVFLEYLERVFTDTNNYYANYAYAFRIVQGQPDGAFYPSETVNREGVAVMIFKTMIPL
jgi:hypothetical protein